MEDEQYVQCHLWLFRAHNLSSWINEIKDVCIVYGSCKNYKLFKGKLFNKYVGKYVEAVPLRDKSALSIARGIYARFIADKMHLSTSSVIKEKSLLAR